MDGSTKTKRWSVIALGIVVCITVVCIIAFTNSTQKVFEKNTKAALTQIFTLPNEVALLKNMWSVSASSYDEDVDIERYFSDQDVIKQFALLSSWGRIVADTADNPQWKANVESVATSAYLDNDKMLYFSINISLYVPDVQPEELIINGRVQRDEKGKINFIRIDDESERKILPISQKAEKEFLDNYSG